jgi:hypothetical protein
MALQFNNETRSTVCDNNCLPGQFKPLVLPDPNVDPKDVVIACQPCSAGCVECLNYEVCDQCSCVPDDICYYKTMMSLDDVVCGNGCTFAETFRTLDKLCINCNMKITGCVRCTDDRRNKCVDTSGLRRANCEYETKCTKCQSVFELSESGDSCCLVKNCEVCSRSDYSVCHKCKNGLFLMSKEYTGTDVDTCVTEGYCTKIAKMPGNGFYATTKTKNERAGLANVCLPCKRNCETCRDPDPMFCRRCMNNSKDRIFFLSDLGQCCAVEYCNDCSGFDGKGIEETTAKYGEKTKDLICQQCQLASCFPPTDLVTDVGRLECK